MCVCMCVCACMLACMHACKPVCVCVCACVCVCVPVLPPVAQDAPISPTAHLPGIWWLVAALPLRVSARQCALSVGIAFRRTRPPHLALRSVAHRLLLARSWLTHCLASSAPPPLIVRSSSARCHRPLVVLVRSSFACGPLIARSSPAHRPLIVALRSLIVHSLSAHRLLIVRSSFALRDICFAREWRAWDVALLCHVPELDVADASAGALLRFVDFHHRACALHVLCYFHFATGQELPGWLARLACAVPIAWKGDMSKLDWVAQGLGQAASMQHGQVHLTWLDVVQQVIHDSSGVVATNLRERIFAISPEHAAKINDGKNMKSLIGRVHPDAYDIMETWQAVHGVGGPSLPQTWLREPAFLLKAGKSQTGTTKEEQLWITRRWLGMLEGVAREEGLDLGFELQLATRKISEADRKKVILVTKKFLQGMAAGVADHKLKPEVFQEEFACGDFDDTIWGTSNPILTGKFWPWIKAAQAKAREVAAEAAIGQATDAAQAAEALADVAVAHAQGLVEEMSKMDTDLEDAMKLEKRKLKQDVLEKLQEAYRRQVAVHWQRQQSRLEDIYLQAEEKLVHYAERRQQALATVRVGLELIRPAKKETFVDISWERLLPSDSPRLLLLDLSFRMDRQADNLAAALRVAGPAGLVVLVASASDIIESSNLFAQEVALLLGVDIKSVLVMRLHLSWLAEEGGPVSGWATLPCNHQAPEQAAAASSLLRRVMTKLTMQKGGSICKLPLPKEADIVKNPHDQGRVVFPPQRGPDFYRKLLFALGVLKQETAEPWDFVLVEEDAGIGDGLLVASQALAAAADASKLIWAGMVPHRQTVECRSRASRLRHLEGLLKKAEEEAQAKAQVALGQDTGVRQEVQQLASRLPSPPLHAPVLAEMLEEVCPRALVDTTAHTVCLGAVDAQVCTVLPEKPANQEKDIMEEMPDNLALARSCQEAGVHVARSQWDGLKRGLYPARRFRKGEVILTCKTGLDRWVCADDDSRGATIRAASNAGRNTPLAIYSVQQLRVFRTPVTLICPGRPSRDPWAALQVSSAIGPQSSVYLEMAHGNMDDSFLSVKAARDLEPFEAELLWCLGMVSGSSSPPSLWPPAQVAAEVSRALEEGSAERAAKRLRSCSPAGEQAPDALAASGGEARPKAEPEAGPPQAELADITAPADAEGHVAGSSAEATGSPEDGVSQATPANTAAQEGLPHEVPADATWLSSLEKPKCEVYLGSGQVWLDFKKPAKQLKQGVVLYACLDGTINSTNVGKQFAMPYDIDQRSTVCVDGAVDTLGKFLPDVDAVWGRMLEGKTLKPAPGPDGSPQQLHWAPKPADLTTCKTFWSMPGVMRVFVMSVEEPSEQGKPKELTPDGVAFVLDTVVKWEKLGKIHRLPVAV